MGDGDLLSDVDEVMSVLISWISVKYNTPFFYHAEPEIIYLIVRHAIAIPNTNEIIITRENSVQIATFVYFVGLRETCVMNVMMACETAQMYIYHSLDSIMSASIQQKLI